MNERENEGGQDKENVVSVQITRGHGGQVHDRRDVNGYGWWVEGGVGWEAASLIRTRFLPVIELSSPDELGCYGVTRVP